MLQDDSLQIPEGMLAELQCDAPPADAPAQPRRLWLAGAVSILLHGLLAMAIVAYRESIPEPTPITASEPFKVHLKAQLRSAQASEQAQNTPDDIATSHAMVTADPEAKAQPSQLNAGQNHHEIKPPKPAVSKPLKRLNLQLPTNFTPLAKDTWDPNGPFDPRLQSSSKPTFKPHNNIDATTGRVHNTAWRDVQGREMLVQGDNCMLRTPGFDRQAQDTVSLPSRCTWMKTDTEKFEDEFKKRLELRFGKKTQ